MSYERQFHVGRPYAFPLFLNRLIFEKFHVKIKCYSILNGGYRNCFIFFENYVKLLELNERMGYFSIMVSNLYIKGLKIDELVKSPYYPSTGSG